MTHHHRIARVAILTLVVAAFAVPSASARFSETQGAPCLSLCNGYGPGATPSQPVGSSTYAQPLGSPRSEVVSGGYDLARLTYAPASVAPSNGGFDWGDAGIGAGVALVIIATATGGAVMFGRHHAHSRLAS
jgi:hypothetical protein